MIEFTKFMKKEQKKMDYYIQAVIKVHGKNHPEIFQVESLYQELQSQKGQSSTKIEKIFQELRQVTDHYKVPEDVCETYRAVYNTLEEADALYFQSN